MSEAMDEQSAPEEPRKRVITVRARGVTPTGPDEISREQFEELRRRQTARDRIRPPT